MYVPPRNHDTNSRMKVLLAKILKALKIQDRYLKNIKVGISRLISILELHDTIIKYIEKQFGWMLAILHQHQPGTLLSNKI